MSCAAHEIRRSVFIRDEAAAFAVIKQRTLAKVPEQMAGEAFPIAGVIDFRWLVNDEFVQISVGFARIIENGLLRRRVQGVVLSGLRSFVIKQVAIREIHRWRES